MRTAIYPIDKTKLRTALAERGMTITDASHKMGYVKVLSGVLGRGSVTKSVMLLIESALGISYDEYKAVEEPEPEPEVEQFTLTAEVLEKTVYDATVYATTYAVEQYMKEHLQNVIEEAIRKVVG